MMKNEYDLLKVFAILLVVSGHITILYNGGRFELEPNSIIKTFTTIIYIFHMPLFIALSGAIYDIGIKRGKYLEFVPFLFNKIKRLLVPFLFVGIVFLVPVLSFLNMTDNSILNSIVGLLICDGTERHLWYLPALFWIFMVVWCLNKMKISYNLLLLLSFLVALFFSMYPNLGVFRFPLGMQYLPYFVLGMWLNQNRELSFKNMAFISLLMILIGLGVNRAITFDPVNIIMKVVFRAGIVSMIIALSRLVKIKSIGSRGKFILDNSFAVYLFHVLIIYVLYSFFSGYIPTLIMIPGTFILSILGSLGIAKLIRLLKLQVLIGEK